MINKVIKNKGTKKYRGGSKGKANLSKRIKKVKNLKEMELLTASVNNNVKEVEKLVKSGVDVNTKIQVENGYEPAIINAIDKRDNDMIKLLINLGAELNIKNDYVMPPLMLAVKQNNKDLVKLLLKNGAKMDDNYFIDEKNIQGIVSSLNIAIFHNYNEIIDILFKYNNDEKNANKKINLNEKEGLDCLYFIDNHELESPTPLRLAEFMGNMKAVELLTRNGADATDLLKELIEGMSPLAKSEIKYFEKLLKSIQGNKTKFEDILILSYEKEEFNLFEMILEKGVRLHFPYKRNNTFFQYLTEGVNNNENDKKFKDLIESVNQKRIEKKMVKEVVKTKEIGEKGLADKITSYLGGRRKTKKRHLKNKQKKTRRSRK